MRIARLKLLIPHSYICIVASHLSRHINLNKLVRSTEKTEHNHALPGTFFWNCIHFLVPYYIYFQNGTMNLVPQICHIIFLNWKRLSLVDLTSKHGLLNYYLLWIPWNAGPWSKWGGIWNLDTTFPMPPLFNNDNLICDLELLFPNIISVCLNLRENSFW